MKKKGYLFLLIPSLFLATSCQTTPKVDTITEKEAQDFIEENFKTDTDDFKEPSDNSKVTWKITKVGTESLAKKLVGNYISTDSTPVEKKEGKDVKLKTGRGAKYKTELNGSAEEYSAPGTDAIIGMNPAIYSTLYETQNDVGNDTLVYKRGPNNGLIIICKSTSSNILNDRTHFYNHEGQETRFEVNTSNEEYAFTLSIDFVYSK